MNTLLVTKNRDEFLTKSLFAEPTESSRIPTLITELSAEKANEKLLDNSIKNALSFLVSQRYSVHLCFGEFLYTVRLNLVMHVLRF